MEGRETPLRRTGQPPFPNGEKFSEQPQAQTQYVKRTLQAARGMPTGPITPEKWKEILALAGLEEIANRSSIKVVTHDEITGQAKKHLITFPILMFDAHAHVQAPEQAG